MSYDVSAVRAHFPALKQGAAHFDGPGGSQVPDVVGDAVRATLVAAIANRGSVTAAERTAEDTVLAARQAVADLLGMGLDGAGPRGVVFRLRISDPVIRALIAMDVKVRSLKR